jgi:hypothetical protein
MSRSWSWYGQDLPADWQNGQLCGLTSIGKSPFSDTLGYCGLFGVWIDYNKKNYLKTRLYERFFDAGWHWREHSLPANVERIWQRLAVVRSDILGVSMFFIDSKAHVFWKGEHRTKPVDLSLLEGAPSAVFSGLTAVASLKYVAAFLTGTNGELYEVSSGDGIRWIWYRHGKPGRRAVLFEPTVVASPSGYIGVFSRSEEGQLFERSFHSGAGWIWYPHGLAPNNIAVFNPVLVFSSSNYLSVFMRGDNAHVYERHFEDGWKWADHGLAPGNNRVFGLTTVASPYGYMGVFMRGDHVDGHLYELYFESQDNQWHWADHGLPLMGTSTFRVLELTAVAAPRTNYVGAFVWAQNTVNGDDFRLIELASS